MNYLKWLEKKEKKQNLEVEKLNGEIDIYKK